jgi:hypothetical protein
MGKRDSYSRDGGEKGKRTVYKRRGRKKVTQNLTRDRERERETERDREADAREKRQAY